MINPLLCFEIEGLPGQQMPVPSYESVVQYLVTSGEDSSLEALSCRYREIVTHAEALSIAPVDVPYVLEKLFWPLRHAMAAYMLTNYLGVIAECGHVSEMVAILWLEMTGFTINGKPLTDEKAKQIYGRTFEKMGQEQRVRLLQGYEMITEPDQLRLDKVRELRRKYLHLLSQPHENIAEDSITAFQATCELVKSALGLRIEERGVSFSPLFDRWHNAHRRR